MKKPIVIVVILIVVFYAGTQAMTMFKVKGEFTTKVERQLDFVDETNQADVKKTLIEEAKKLEIPLRAENIYITYEDTDIQSYAQRVVGGKLGATFKNKRVVITAQYKYPIAAIPVDQEVSTFKIRQVQAPQLPPSKAAQEVLDSN